MSFHAQKTLHACKQTGMPFIGAQAIRKLSLLLYGSCEILDKVLDLKFAHLVALDYVHLLECRNLPVLKQCQVDNTLLRSKEHIKALQI